MTKRRKQYEISAELVMALIISTAILCVLVAMVRFK